MSAAWIVFWIGVYFALLALISYWSNRRVVDEIEAFMRAERRAPWYLVAFGMIGTTLSGVTYISIPGMVGTNAMRYLQVVIGYWFGYLIIALVLLPLYYKGNFYSIYGYLEQRFGKNTRKIGGVLFFISRLLGAAARLYLAILVLQFLLFERLNIPLPLSAAITLLFILLYTQKGGIKTIIRTDLLQTTFMLSALAVILWLLYKKIGQQGFLTTVFQSPYGKILETNPEHPHFWLKDLITGIFIAVAMTGLDQDMMQKNLSIPKLRSAQYNVITYASAIVVVNFFFLLLGAYLYLFLARQGIQQLPRADQVFPMVATQYFPTWVAVLFLLGLIAAAYSSADGSMAALTTSLYVDILQKNPKDIHAVKRKRKLHVVVAILMLLCIFLFYFQEKWLNFQWRIIDLVLRMGAYTYGPLLGLFAFGLLKKNAINERWILPVVLFPPLFCLLWVNFPQWFFHYRLGDELILVNALLTFVGLLIIQKRNA